MPKVDEADLADAVDTHVEGKRRIDQNDALNFRNAIRWESFARKKYAFGFDKLARKDIPSMSERAHGIAISFRKIDGWKIPKAIFEDLQIGQCNVSVQLSMSLLHLRTMTFFGNTWIGVPLNLRENEEREVIAIDYPEILYLISRIIDPSCVGIVEIIVTKTSNTSKDKQVISSQYGY